MRNIDLNKLHQEVLRREGLTVNHQISMFHEQESCKDSEPSDCLEQSFSNQLKVSQTSMNNIKPKQDFEYGRFDQTQILGENKRYRRNTASETSTQILKSR